jgi:hypothetical protein
MCSTSWATGPPGSGSRTYRILTPSGSSAIPSISSSHGSYPNPVMNYGLQRRPLPGRPDRFTRRPEHSSQPSRHRLQQWESDANLVHDPDAGGFTIPELNKVRCQMSASVAAATVTSTAGPRPYVSIR